MSDWHQRRSILSMLGTQDLDYTKSKTLGELQHESLESTREDLKMLTDHNATMLA